MASSGLRPIRDFARRTLNKIDGHGGADRGAQISLSFEWQRLAREGILLPFRDVEFRNYSQNGEDGILLYLFSLAGSEGRRAIEMCAGDGIENNSSNLVLHHDWDALMIDGDKDLLKRGRAFYARDAETYRVGPTLVDAWLNTENVNDLLAREGYDSDIDLLSLDMDGVDYWILRAIALRPRVMIIEYNNCVPASESVTVPYDPRFVAKGGGAWDSDGFFGASLQAFTKLLGGRGYRLVGSNRPDTNAFFLREDVLPEMPATTVENCLQSRWARHRMEIWESVASYPWEQV